MREQDNYDLFISIPKDIFYMIFQLCSLKNAASLRPFLFMIDKTFHSGI